MIGSDDIAKLLGVYDALPHDPHVLEDSKIQNLIHRAIELLDRGQIRVAMPPSVEGGMWIVNEWVKKVILLYFRIANMESLSAGPMEYWDKIALKSNYKAQNVRVVPPAVARYGSYIEEGVILMPSYVNIGSYVATGTMVDTWATIGSCAQIGRNVHLSGGVGIGGVLEPPQASPVIIEDDAFLGSRVIVVEGVMVEKGAVLGSGVILTASTKIVDVTGETEKIIKGHVPCNSVVIPGSISKEFPSGTYQVNCALIIGKRKESTNKKTSLNDALRHFEVNI